jgi:hypothetical protein
LRDEFKAKAMAQAEAGEVALKANKGQLETQWQGFEAQVRTYFDILGKRVEDQTATFQIVAAAQVKAWREAAEKFQSEAAKFAAALAESRKAFDRANQQAGDALKRSAQTDAA